jgi:hypothetical protein
LIVSGFKTSPLDSFKIDSGEASPIDILLNLLQDSYLIIIISIIHHSFTIDLIAIKKLIIVRSLLRFYLDYFSKL